MENNRITTLQDLYFLIEAKQFTLKIFFFGIKLWPNWFRYNTFHRKKGDSVVVGPRSEPQARHWLCLVTIQFLFFEMVIPYWQKTKAGKMYPVNYTYTEDPDYEKKLEEYQAECEF